MLDLIEAAERVDQRHKPETIERAREVQAILAWGGTLAQAATTIERAYSTTVRLAAIDLERRDASARRAIVVTLALAGPRASECCALDVPDADLANRRLLISGTKTDAAERNIKIVDFLREELLRYKLDVELAQAGPFFPSATGRRRTKDNLRQRECMRRDMFAGRGCSALEAQAVRLAHNGGKDRRTFISLLIAHRADR